jgi:hypothetical protein
MKTPLLLSALLILAMSAKLYSQQTDYSRYMLDLIPNNAVFVATVKAKSVESKMSWQKMSEMSLSENLLRLIGEQLSINDNKFFLELMRNPKSKGIDFPEDLMAFAGKQSDKKFINIILPLKDVEIFKAEISNYFGPNFNNSIIAKGQFLTYTHNERTAISWNKNIAVVTLLLPNISNFNFSEQDKSITNIALGNYLDRICSADTKETMQRNSLFTDWNAKVRDAGIWVDYKEVMRLNLENYIGATKLPKQALNLIEILLNNNRDIKLASDISFEKGEILSNTVIYADQDLINLSRSATSNRANKRMLQYIDGQKTGFYMTMASSPKGVYEGFKIYLGDKAGGLKASVEDLFGLLEIFIDEKDAFNFLKGDLFYAINGLKTVEKITTEYEYDSEKDEYVPIETKTKEQIPLLTVGFSYGKKEQILKIIGLFEKSRLLRKTNKNLYQLSLPTFGDEILLKLDKGLLVISNDAQRMIENKKYRPLSKKHNGYLKTDFQTFYLNTAAFTDIIQGIGPLGEFKPILKNFKDGVGDMSIHSRRPKKKDNYLTQNFVLDLRNKEENALKQLFDFADRIYNSTMKGL